MVKFEGTYTCVKTPAFFDFYEKLGLAKEMVEKLVGSQWTMTLWKDGDVTWGVHFKCKELPELNCIEHLDEGVEKVLDNPSWGGKSKILTKKTDDGFETSFDSEKAGPYKCVEHYMDEGVTMIWTIKGNEYTEFWERAVAVNGAYAMTVEENMVDYFSALPMGSDELARNLGKYKAYFKVDGDSFELIESFGDLGKVKNILKLNQSVPFYVPGEDITVPTERRASLTKPRFCHYLLVINNPEGNVEEWTFTFTENHLRMTGLDKDSCKRCWMELKKFVEISGTYKFASSIGYEEFASSVGIPLSEAQEMANDYGARLVIADLGNGWLRLQSNCKNHSNDVRFKLDEEFEYHDNVLNENVKSIATMQGNVLAMTTRTSKGLVKSSMTFNQTFVVAAMTLDHSDKGTKTIFERC